MLRRGLLAGGLAGLLTTRYAWRESKWVERTETVVGIPNLPPALDGFRILHVSDTHFPSSGESAPRFLAAARRCRYDLVVATGDYADS